MPIGTTAAIIGAGVLGAGASVLGAKNNSKAISKSTDASLQAQREANVSAEKIAAQQIAAQKDALTQGLGYQTNALNATNSLQAGAYNSSGQLQADLYNQRNKILQPWAAGGGAAFNQLNSMLGLQQQTFTAPSQIGFTPVQAQAIPTGPPATVPGAPVTANPAQSPGGTPAVQQPVTAPISTGAPNMYAGIDPALLQQLSAMKYGGLA